MRQDVLLKLYGRIRSDEVLEEILRHASGCEDADGNLYDFDPEDTLERLLEFQEAREPMPFKRRDTYDSFGELRATAMFGGLAFQFFEGQEGANNYASVTTFTPGHGDEETALLEEGTIPAMTLRDLEELNARGLGIQDAIDRLGRIMPEEAPISVDEDVVAAWRARQAQAPAV